MCLMLELEIVEGLRGEEEVEDGLMELFGSFREAFVFMRFVEINLTVRLLNFV
jgi:hypothetical protein